MSDDDSPLLTTFQKSTYNHSFIVSHPYHVTDGYDANVPFLLSIILLFLIPMRKIVNYLHIPIHDHVIYFAVASIFSLIVNTAYIRRHDAVSNTVTMNVLAAVLPLVSFRNAFVMEMFIFRRAAMQICLVAVLGCLLNGAMFGLVVGPFVSGGVRKDWDVSMCVLFGMVSTVSEGCDSMVKVKEMERNKHLLIILEGETLISNAVSMTCFHVFVKLYMNVDVYWYSIPLYSVVVYLVFYVVLAIIAGFLIGKLAAYTMGFFSNDPINALLMTLCFIYTTYIVCEFYLLVSGPTATIMVCENMAHERGKLTRDVVHYIKHFYEFLLFLVRILVLTLLCSSIFVEVFCEYGWYDLWHISFTYCFSVCSRMIAIFMMAPLVTWLGKVGGGYPMHFKSFAFLGWAGSGRGVVSVLFAVAVFQYRGTREAFRPALPHVLATIVLSMLVNTTTYGLWLKQLGFSEMSLVRKTNMQHCMVFLEDKRQQLNDVLKLNRHMADANFYLVSKYTVLKNPYKTRMIYDEEELFDKAAHVSICPNCQHEVPIVPTKKEHMEMIADVHMRIMKSQKISFIRQYEHGLLNKEGIRFLLQCVDTGMETAALTMKLDDYFKLFQKKGFFYCLKAVAKKLYFKEDFIRPPSRKWKRMCYNISLHPAFITLIYVCCLLVPLPIYMRGHFRGDTLINNVISDVPSLIFTLIFLLEFLFKLFGYSKYSYLEGFRLYWRSHWNKLDMIVVIVNMICLILLPVQYTVMTENMKNVFWWINLLNDIARMVRLFKLIRLFCIPVITVCKTKINQRIGFAYDIGKAIVTTNTEVEEILAQLADNFEIRQLMYEQLESNRLSVNNAMAMVVKVKPNVAIEVKTKQAIRATITHLKHTIMELKTLGYLDNFEFERLISNVNDQNKTLKNMTKVKPTSPKMIFGEVPWMLSTDPVSEFLFSNADVITWETNDVVMEEDGEPGGVYILLQGLLKSTYTPRHDYMKELRYYGVMPIVDYTNPLHADTAHVEYIFAGNTFGELSVVTQRRYNARIVSDATSRAIILNCGLMKQAFETSCDPVQGLACRMWKYISVEVTTSLLLDTPIYQSYSHEQIHLILERAFVPNLSCYRTFIVTDLMEDIIVIEGLVADINTGNIYAAPCYLPRLVQKLSLVSDSELEFFIKVPPKLLIIPVKDVDEYDIMEREEDIAELVSNPSSKHLLSHQKKKKRKKHRNLFGSTKRKVQDKDRLTDKSRTMSIAFSSSHASVETSKSQDDSDDTSISIQQLNSDELETEEHYE